MHAKLITPKCLQGCAHKLWLSWGFVGVGGDVARMLRDIVKGLLLSTGEKNTQLTISLLPSLIENKKALPFWYLKRSYEGLNLPVTNIYFLK